MDPRYHLARLLALVIFKVWNRVRVVDVDNVPRTGPVILAGNHLSFIDNVVIPVVVPRRVRFLAKSDYFTGTGLRGAWYRFFFSSVGAVPLPRGTHTDAAAALDIARGLLTEGEAFGIYPEGTRSRDGRLYRGRTGVAWLALRTGAVIVPVGLTGTDRAQPVGSSILYPRHITVAFGEPVRVEQVAHLSAPAQKRRALTDCVMERIAALTGQPEADRYNEPPPA
ncbi:MAG: lysophospholipid acyltransferase family protein [Actinomycetales bacterium]